MATSAMLDKHGLFAVDQQLSAYNDRDIENFMKWWAADCEYFEFPGKLLAKGADAIRARHVERFKDTALHGKLINRIAAGNLVVDQETVTRTFPEGLGEIDVVAIYELAGGKIAKAWFSFGEIRIQRAS